MSKFNRPNVRAATGRSPLRTSEVANGTTAEGHPGYDRDSQSELFLLAVSNFVGEDTFYEGAKARDERYRNLIHANTLAHTDWSAALLTWLRSEGNMRSAPLVGAAEFVKARRNANLHGTSRQAIASVLQRPDEPGEALAYWTSMYGRSIPQPIKRGIADAATRLYTEFAVLKYDSENRKGFRFADVLELCHPKKRAEWQGDLFKYILDKRHHPDTAVIPESLMTLRARAELMAVPVDQRRAALDPERLQAAGMTWEALAGWLQGPMDRQAWEAIIPSMGIMALIRNLRNFDEARVSNAVADQIADKIKDPEVVEHSRQLPFRWWSAYRNAHNDRWRVPLGRAIDHALRNLPELPGRTLILVDTSASMSSMGFTARSTVAPVHTAALFGVALANRNPGRVDLHGYATGVFEHEIRLGASTLREMEKFANRIGEVGHGTMTGQAIRSTFKNHDRVIVITDEQAHPSSRSVSGSVPENVPLYAFNIGGYAKGMLPDSPNRIQLGGLGDQTFKMIPLLEAGKNGQFPFEANGAS